MSTVRLLTAAPALIGLGALISMAALVLAYARQLRREEARAAERRARPPDVHGPDAAQAAADKVRTRIEEQPDD